MNLELTTEQAQELENVLELSLRELSHEIAATDNAGYRAELDARRHQQQEVKEILRHRLGLLHELRPEELERELSHPGGGGG